MEIKVGDQVIVKKKVFEHGRPGDIYTVVAVNHKKQRFATHTCTCTGHSYNDPQYPFEWDFSWITNGYLAIHDDLEENAQQLPSITDTLNFLKDRIL